MIAAPSVLHEIYVKDSGDWVIHANYTPHEGRKCISDAEELYNSGRFAAVRVIKESYDPEENMAREEIAHAVTSLYGSAQAREPECRDREDPSGAM